MNILAGEIQLTEGQTEAAIESFKQAVELDSLDYDEPEPLPFAACHQPGQALPDTANPPRPRRFSAQS